jgi:uncharacterized protein (DUF697 family)
MPKLGSKGAFGAIGTARNFVNVLKELSLDEIRDEAGRVPAILVLAPDDVTAARIGVLLTGPDAVVRPTATALFAPVRDLDRYEAVVVYDPTNTGQTEELRRRAQRDGQVVPVVRFLGSAPDSASAAERVRRSIVTRLPNRAPAFGRAYPAFRDAATKAVIDETAQVNAQFAFVSNLPAVVPVVGSFFAAGADLLILTKNQLLMLYKLAAIHGKNLENRTAFMQEMLSVVGAAMIWRSAARELTSFLPFAAGTIPKVVIAFSGTVVVGRIADYYYQFGKRPSSEQVRSFYRYAADAAKRIRLPGSDQDGTDGREPPSITVRADEPSAREAS